MDKKESPKNKQEKKDVLKKIKDISVTEDERFGMPLVRSFVEEIHYLRDGVASRLNTLTTGYDNISEEYKLKLISKELVEIELFCCGHKDVWFLVIKRDGTIVFEKRDGKSKSGEEYVIPPEWSDKQILNYQMPERLVKEHLKRIYWTSVCYEAVLRKAETKLADALAAAADKELRKSNDARRELTSAINSMKDERKRLESAQKEHDKVSEELKELKASMKSKLTTKQQALELKRKIKAEADAACKALSKEIAQLEKETKAVHAENNKLKSKLDVLNKKKAQN